MPDSVDGLAEMAGINGHGMAEFGGRCRRNRARRGEESHSEHRFPAPSSMAPVGIRAGRNSLWTDPGHPAATMY